MLFSWHIYLNIFEKFCVLVSYVFDLGFLYLTSLMLSTYVLCIGLHLHLPSLHLPSLLTLQPLSHSQATRKLIIAILIIKHIQNFNSLFRFV